jgi:hypothetical protein
MPSAFRDPKSLADWIQLDYFRRPRNLRRWRGWLGWATLLLTAVVVAVVILLPGGKETLQAGPVSSAHALFNADCVKCHTESFQTARRLLPGSNEAIHAVPNSACVDCHDGPAHNDKQQAEQSCAECHREHRGRVLLARVGDEHCTVCHVDLKASLRPGAETAFQNVSPFPAGHPEFKLWREQLADPGRLHFNHKVHLKPEGVLVARGTTEVLNCSSCHREDSAGRYMQPIQYTTHCARCHPLSVKLAGLFEDERLKEAAAEFEKEPAPHKEPAVVRAVLRDRLIRFVQDNPVVSKKVTNKRAVPRPSRLEAIDELQWEWSKKAMQELLFGKQQLAHTEGLLFDRAGGCVYCHIPEGASRAERKSLDELPTFSPRLPARWFEHSRFGHDSHRMLACTECHPATESSKTSDVLMPRIETCAQCHNARSRVRTDCVECHVYHHRDPRVYEGSKNHTIAQTLGGK